MPTGSEKMPGRGDRWNNVARQPGDPHFILVDILAKDHLVSFVPAFKFDGSVLPESIGVVLKDPKARELLQRVTRNQDFLTLYFANHGANITPELMHKRVVNSEFFNDATKEMLLKQYWASRGDVLDSENGAAFTWMMREHIERIVEREKGGSGPESLKGFPSCSP